MPTNNSINSNIPIEVTKGGTGIATVAQGDILYGSAANTISALTKNTTATRYLANTGTSNNPAWDQVNMANGVTGTLPVGNGGTGSTTFNINGPVISSTTTTGALTAVTLANQEFLVGNTSAAPTKKTLKTVLSFYNASGTYTHTFQTGMIFAFCEVQGSGGGGGGCASNAGATLSCGGGGGGGSYTASYLTAATLGASQTVTVGAGGTAGANTGGNGGNGGATSLGTLLVVNGGLGGTGGAATANAVSRAGGVGSTIPTGGQMFSFGQGGAPGFSTYTSSTNYIVTGGAGGNSRTSGGGQMVFGNSGGNSGGAYGAGGGGASGTASGGGGLAGGAGSQGTVTITEFILS